MLVEGFRPGVMARLGLDEPTVRALQPGHRLLLHLRLRAARPAGRPAGTRRQLPGVGGGADARGRRRGTIPPLPTADLAAGLTAAFGICAARRWAAHERRGGPTLDVSMTDVLSTWTGPVRRRDRPTGRAPGRPGPRPATASSRRPTAGRWRSASSTSSTSGRACARSSDWRTWSPPRLRRALPARGRAPGAVGAAIATRPRDELVARLVAAGVPVAPVLDRQGMLAAAPFPTFPIRLPLPDGARTGPDARPAPRRGLRRPALTTDGRPAVLLRSTDA